MTFIGCGDDKTDPFSSDNLVPELIRVCTIAPVFSLLFVCLRFYNARAVLRTVFKDDWLILPAMALSIGYSISTIFMTKHGLGYHGGYLISVDPTWSPKVWALLSGFPSSITSNLATLFIKTSILVFYLRFSTSRLFNVVVKTLIVVVVIANSLGAFGVLFACQPMKRFWDLSVEGTCIKNNIWYEWLIVMNCTTDLIILILPAWILAPLSVSYSQKLLIAAILGTGGFVVGVSILRVVIMERGKEDMDLTYRFAINYFWTTIEINVAIVCACAPCLRPLIAKFIPSVMNLGVRQDNGSAYTAPMSEIAQRRPQRPQMAGSHAELIRNSNEEGNQFCCNR